MDNELKIVEGNAEITKPIEMIKPQVIEKRGMGRLILEQVSRNDDFLLNVSWGVIKSYVEEIAKGTLGEYKGSTVYYNLIMGQSLLYMGYCSNLKEDIAPDMALKHHLKTPKDSFAGYVIINPSAEQLLIWQTYVIPEYQRTTILDLGFERIYQYAKLVGYPRVVFASYRDEELWKPICEKYGFKKTYTMYAKEMK